MNNGKSAAALGRCVVCGKKLYEGDSVFLVKLNEPAITIQDLFSPTCSKECFYAAIQKRVTALQRQIADVQEQTPIEEKF